ncbi:nucleotide sugar dehydrogenase [Patescibacteria group bacterium]|nr:nucleotide sugar dehydrogenase [Patescibacteria group bacterium]
MKIGIVGCGKLGLMVALTIESKGHEVVGYDIDPRIGDYLQKRSIPFKEEHADELLANTRMKMVSLDELVNGCELIFMAVQTPHASLYEGITRIPETRADFDYSFLKDAVSHVNNRLKEDKVIVIISTVLPGTIDREIRPLMGPHFKLVYEPLFIAMGTVYTDYLYPEFVLVGVDEQEPALKLEEFYKTINNAPVFKTDIRSAEAIKVFYNAFVTMKTVLGNIYGEIAYKLGANADDIHTALSMATDRVISSKYLKAGMGDGGGCHPRDNIALSFVARKLNLSFDIFDALMKAREAHTEWLAYLIAEKHIETGLRVVVLGRSFKPETNITTGSPSMLLSNILEERGVKHLSYDPYIDNTPLDDYQAVYFIATRHNLFAEKKFPKGSIVIDPFRYIPNQDGVDVIRIGGL